MNNQFNERDELEKIDNVYFLIHELLNTNNVSLETGLSALLSVFMEQYVRVREYRGKDELMNPISALYDANVKIMKDHKGTEKGWRG